MLASGAALAENAPAAPVPAPAGSAVVPSVAPGIYSVSQYVSFSKPAGSRLLLSLDGSPYSEIAGPLALSVPEGGVHAFTVDSELHSLDPAVSSVTRSRFVWTIDRAPPAAPSFTQKTTEGGRTVTLNLSEPGTVFWHMYHPLYRADASGSVAPGDSVFVPEGAVLCTWGVDRAGNRGPAASADRYPAHSSSVQYRLASPAPGIWANPQMLVVEKGTGVRVSYTTDGSDPASSGIVYSGPTLLSDVSISSVRILAVDSNGRSVTDRIAFSVTRDPPASGGRSPVPELPADGSLVKTGEFMELHMPNGYTCSAGNSVNPDSAGTQLVLSSVRGVSTYFPITVTNGDSQWRWMCAGGLIAAAGDVAPASSLVQPGVSAADTAPTGTTAVAPGAIAAANSAASPVVSIHDWYFVDVYWKVPVYASLDDGPWQELPVPRFVDRSAPHKFRWYSDSWKGGEIQTVDLPPKPAISGIPANALSADPVFISAPGSSYTLQYEGGYFTPDGPSASSLELSSGLLVETPKGTESHFAFRFRALHDGLVHGEIDASFDIDRKAPRTPSAGIPDSLSYSRVPVTLKPAGEDILKVSISPELFTQTGSTFTLTGDPSRSVDYTVTISAADLAGNKSRVLTRKLTVDINALYVDASAPGVPTGSRDGTPSAPYISLDDALDSIRGGGAWRVYVRGDTVLSSAHTLKNDISVIGSGGTISVGAGGSLTVLRSSLSLKNVPMLRARTSGVAADPTDRLPKASSPFISLENARFVLDNSTLRTFDSRSGTLIRARNSSVSFAASKVSFVADDYALLLDADHCDVTVRDSMLAVQSRDASALALAASTAALESSTVTVSAVSACRAVESWDSLLKLRDLSLVRNTLAAAETAAPAGTASGTDSTVSNRDSALWLDAKSRIISESGVTFSGFWRLRDTGPSR